MTKIIRLPLRRTALGNDPNDNRSDPHYLDEGEELARKALEEQEDGLGWTSQFEVSDEEVDAIEDPQWAYEDFLIESHWMALTAESGKGKTTVAMFVAAELVRAGYRVYYVNADCSGPDAKRWYLVAQQAGITLLLPDLKVGRSMQDVVRCVEEMASNKHADLSGVVFFFDTLKKMTDVISKQASKEMYATLRALTARSATICTLGHTNKHKTDDGNYIFEGTGDLRSDCDDMIYLTADKLPDGRILVSTVPDKQRGSFKPITFAISPPDMAVTRTDYVDVDAEKTARQQMERDRDVIAAITEMLQAKGTAKQIDIVAELKGKGIPAKRARAVLLRYGGGDGERLWSVTRGMAKGMLLYSLDRDREAQ